MKCTSPGFGGSTTSLNKMCTCYVHCPQRRFCRMNGTLCRRVNFAQSKPVELDRTRDIDCTKNIFSARKRLFCKSDIHSSWALGIAGNLDGNLNKFYYRFHNIPQDSFADKLLCIKLKYRSWCKR